MDIIKSFDNFSFNTTNDGSLNENLKLDGDKLVWDSNSKYGVIRSRFGKYKDATPYNCTFKLVNDKTLTITSLFGRNDITSTEFIKAIKGKSSVFSLDPQSEEILFNRSAIYLAKILREIGKIDCIITLQSSSELNRKILNKAMSKYIGKVPVYEQGIIKNQNSVEVNIDELSQQKLNDKTISTLNKAISKWVDSNYVEIKHVMPQFRKFIRNWLKVKPEIETKLDGKRVILFDDLLTSGSSLIEAAQQCYDFGAADVQAITFLGKA